LNIKTILLIPLTFLTAPLPTHTAGLDSHNALQGPDESSAAAGQSFHSLLNPQKPKESVTM